MPLVPRERESRARVDWDAIKDRTPIKAVAERYAGPPARGLLWRCPMPDHEDRNPSFSVDPSSGRWTCWSRCGSGDAIDLVRRIEGATFQEAAARLASMFGLEGGEHPGPAAPPRSKPPAPPGKRQAEPSGVSPAEALAIRQEGEARALEAVERLWSREGREALAHLRGRGLTDATIGAARLGFASSLAVPRKGGGSFLAGGITIPWFGDDGRLALLKVRQIGGREPRYIEAFRGRLSLFAPFGVRHGWPLIVCEGELDALLLAQELGHVASVVTLGSASGEPSREGLRAIRRAPRMFIATDADPAGDKAAMIWPSWAVRIRPEGGKDWGELRAGGAGRIAYVWGRFLPSLGCPPNPEDFADPSLYALPPDERDRIEAREEREAIQATAAEPEKSAMSTARAERSGDKRNPWKKGEAA